MIFTNARIIFPDAIREDLAVTVCAGKIVEIGQPVGANDAVDLHGNFLAPGFIDLHVHGGKGHDAMEAKAEAFHAICDYHASGGTSSLWWMTKNEWLGLLDVAGMQLESLAGGFAGEPFGDESREYVVVAKR